MASCESYVMPTHAGNNPSLVIVGAGLAGLLAGNMLARHRPTIYERQAELPNNHSAVLRFATSIIGDVLGIPFREVTMMKASASWMNPVADALNYSFKNLGQYRSDRSIVKGIVTEKRYIAPPDLVAIMADRLAAPITFDTDYTFNGEGRSPVISTIPMPILMSALNYERRPEFRFRSGRNVRAKVKECDAYCSLLVPHPESVVSRISLTGNELIVECTAKEEPDATTIIGIACELLGFRDKDVSDVTEYKQQYQKIMPISEAERKNFMHWATDRFNIFSLGRFATWRPSLQMDDLVNDIRKIEGWTSNRYELARSR
jgi:hypothetical protein